MRVPTAPRKATTTTVGQVNSQLKLLSLCIGLRLYVRPFDFFDLLGPFKIV